MASTLEKLKDTLKCEVCGTALSIIKNRGVRDNRAHFQCPKCECHRSLALAELQKLGIFNVTKGAENAGCA